MALKKTISAWLILCMLATGVPLTIAQAEEAELPDGAVLFVAPDGSDSNSGAEHEPLRTLEGARDAIRAWKNGEGLPAGGVTVYLREGVYERRAAFELSEIDSGTEEAPIVYRAYPGETVRLSGGHILDRDSFGPVTDQSVLQRIIDEEARGKVLQVNLAALGMTDYGQMSRHGYWKANDVSLVPPMELFIDGQGMTLARWPNEGTVQMGEIIDPGPTVKDDDLQLRGGTFGYTYDRPKYWSQADDIWLDGIFGYSWEWSYNKVAAIDTANKTITLQYGEMSGLLKNWYPDFHFAQNLLEELDAPGEYYIDRTNGVLYLMPNAAFRSGHGDVTVTMLKEPMILTSGASHIRFEGLSLEYGRDSAAVILGGSNVVIANSDISNFTNGGVLINSPGRYAYDGVESERDGRNHAVISSHIRHIGGTAVTLHGGDPETLEPGNNRVENTHIHDFAYYHKAYNPGVLFSGVGNRAIGNEIHDAPHPGIVLYGNDHVIEYNEIYDICKQFQDLGAIYMNAGIVPQERGTVIRRNYFHHIGEHLHGVEGIYPDNMTMDMVIEENIFYKMGNSAIKSNTGSYIYASNNIFVDTFVPYDNYEMFMSKEPGNRVDRDYMPAWLDLFERYNDFVGTPYAEKYPELLTFFDEDRYFPTTNVFERNLIYNPTLTRSNQTNEHGVRDIHNLMNYSDNWVANEDPGFVNLAAGDFRLKHDAEVFGRIPGFAAIPFEEIGTQGKVGLPHGPDSIAVSGIYLPTPNLSMEMGKTASLRAEVVPWNATNAAIVYSSSDKTVATVDANGDVSGHAPGVAVIKAVLAENPAISDESVVTITEGDGVMHFTDFESGGNGWLVDANHSIVPYDDGNHWYRIANGANSQHPRHFADYVLEYRLKTPETIPNGAVLIMYDRNGENGSGHIRYLHSEDGSSWVIYNSQWQTMKETAVDSDWLQPNTVYDIRMAVHGASISVYVDGNQVIQGENPTHSSSGTVGFYVEGFSYLEFDDVQFSLPRRTVESVTMDSPSIHLNEGGQKLLHAIIVPEDATNKTLLWSSSNPEVAVVDESGFVTATGRGEAVITARSAQNPDAYASVIVIVSDVLHAVDFESGGSGWLVDANHSIAADDDGNHWYRIVNGASSKSPVTFSNYVLTYKLRTPDSIPVGATLLMYDRDGSDGRGYVSYKKKEDGSSWSIMNSAWQVEAEAAFDGDELLPNTIHDIKVVAQDAHISLFVDGELRLQGENPSYNSAGQVGFYVEGFSYLEFDDIVFSLVRVPAEAIQLDLDKLSLEPGESISVTAAVYPPDATDKKLVWSSGNPEVAVVDGNGTIKAIAPGTTVVTAASRENPDVHASIAVTVSEVDYPVIELDRQLRDTNGWTAADAVQFGEGTVRIYGDGVFGYEGETFGSELIRLKAKFGQFNGGWYGFALRSVRTGDPTWVDANKGYLIVIKEDQIEFQTWKPGQTMVEIIPNTTLLAGHEHDIDIGAVDVDGGVRFILKVDGKTVLNVLDADPDNPIASEGYLNVYNYAGAADAIELMPISAPDPGSEPGTEPEPGPGAGPGTGSDSGSNVPSDPQPNSDMVIVHENDLNERNRDGVITVELESEQSGVLLSQEIIALLEVPLAIRSGDVTITIEPALLIAIAEAQPEGAQVILNMTAVTGSDEEPPSANYRMIGVPYQLELLSLIEGEDPIYLSDFPLPIRLVYTIMPSSGVNEEWLGVYYKNPDGEWEYVGGDFDPASRIVTVELSHFSVYAVMEYEAAFSDLPQGHWASDAVKALAAKHIVAGKSADRFDPDGTTTRAEFTALLVRSLGLRAETAQPLPFRDVLPTDWHADEIAAAYEAKLVFGRQDRLFAPNEQITREEMATMLLRAYVYASGAERAETNAVEPKDLGVSAEWAQAAISDTVGLGLMTGYPDGLFKPKSLATRVESAQVIYQLLKLL